MGIDLNAIDDPVNMTAAELLKILETDRELAIAIAQCHGLIGPNESETITTTAQWIDRQFRGRPCQCCGEIHD